MQLEGALAEEYFAYVRQLVEVVFHTLYADHGLPAFVDGQGLVFNRLRGHVDLWQLPDAGQYGVVGRGRLALYGRDLQLWVEGREERGHQVAEAVEHAQCDHQGHRGHGHAHHGDAADEVDDVGRLLREEVSACYVERKIHGCKGTAFLCSMQIISVVIFFRLRVIGPVVCHCLAPVGSMRYPLTALWFVIEFHIFLKRPPNPLNR